MTRTNKAPSAEAGRAAAPVAPPAAIGLHGTLVPFDPTQEEWSEYAERLVYYFTANDITAKPKRRAILLAVGPTMYCLLETLASPEQVINLTFDELVTKAKTHFDPKSSPIVKRCLFNTRCQEEGEAVVTLVVELRKIAEYCEFADILSDMLRDRVVCGNNAV